MTDGADVPPESSGSEGDGEGEALAQITSSRLLRAVEGVLAAQRAEKPAGGEGGSAGVEGVLAAVARQIEDLARGRPAEPAEIPTLGTLRPVRAAEAVRNRLLRDWAEDRHPTDAQEVVELLGATEELVTSLWDAKEEDPAERLSDPDALELVVELAHDLHSPLNSILFLAETVRSGHSGPLNEQQVSQLGLMYSAALRIMSMVGNVMELAKRRESLTPDGAGAFSIREVFDTVQELVRPMAEEKGVELEFRPPSADGFIGHSVPLSRVLLNLTTNGLKFTDEGTVRVSAREVKPSVVEFSVEDTGRGIPAEKQDLLFQPFQKASGRDGHFFSVSGLGLAIVRRLVEAMGSELELETQEGKGSRFYFKLHLPTENGKG